MDIGQVRQFFAGLPLMLSRCSRFPTRKLLSKNRLLHSVPKFSQYSSGIWPEYWFCPTSIVVRFPYVTKFTGKQPCKLLTRTSSTRGCVGNPRYVDGNHIREAINRQIKVIHFGQSEDFLNTEPEDLLSLKSIVLRLISVFSGEM
ncbi:hypothetical protein U1Q18_030435 [Sarracenia purpurea var. burkii]